MKNLSEIRMWLRDNGADETLLDENGVYNGSLYLGQNRLTSVTFPEGMTIGGSLYLGYNQLTSVTFPEGMTIGGYLDLEHNQLTSVTFPEGMTIGGPLDLEHNQLTSVTFPEGMTICGYLDLRYNQLTSVTFPEGMTIGGSLYLGQNRLTSPVVPPQTKEAPSVLHWKWRDKHYIKADGIFQQVVSHRGKVYRVKDIGAKDVTYLVTDGNGRWSHGKTLKEAREDLIYKISDRDTSKYEALTLDSVLSKAEAIQCYRVITGACAAGTRSFCETLGKMKSKYSIREIIELTKGQYGHESFAEFFNH